MHVNTFFRVYALGYSLANCWLCSSSWASSWVSKAVAGRILGTKCDLPVGQASKYSLFYLIELFSCRNCVEDVQ